MLINVLPLKNGRRTVLYFDSESIQDDYNALTSKSGRNGPAYKDGTMNGLDKVEIDHITGDIYITDGRSPETSEIYRCMKRKYEINR